MNTPSFLKQGSANPVSIAFALFVVYVVWGSTFVGIAYAVEEMPPYTLTGFRFILAGLLISVIVLILIDPKGQAGWYALIAVLNPIIWSIGSFLVKAVDTPKGSLTTAAWQTFVGGWAAILFGVLLGENTALFFEAEKTSTWIAFFYISIMAAMAYSAYAYLLDNAPISLIATHAFINPIVAVLLGTWLRGEQFSLAVLLGGLVVVVGVALVVLGERPKELLEPEL